MKLSNYIQGRWLEGQDDSDILWDPALGTEIARASTAGIDMGAALDYARKVGGPNLRKLSYGERAELLSRVAAALSARRDEYFRIALINSGSPKTDASVDIDGAIFTLKYFAREGAALGDKHLLRHGDLARVGKDESFQAMHIATPLEGAAVLINAFNFPAWGLWEKTAPALLSGVPVVIKPATATAWLAQQMVKDVVDAGILPVGALSLICGKARDLLDHVTGADAISFTGSADTAAMIRSAAAVVRHSARVNVEADSLNVALLGLDAQPGSPEFDLLVKEVVAEMTIKAGQKCTAIRRVLVPASQLDAVVQATEAALAKVRIGNPRNAAVTMGPLVSRSQQQAVLAGLAELQKECRTVTVGSADLVDADPKVAAFVAPTLLVCAEAAQARAVHEVEVFGPVATVLPYRDFDDAIALAARGQGSLVASVFSGDSTFLERAAVRLSPTHGRVNLVNATVAKAHTGHGNVMPMSIHGGPGRAGGGQELGGLRALGFYHRLTAIQAPVDSLQNLVNGSGQLHV